jgi:hypothetical protein
MYNECRSHYTSRLCQYQGSIFYVRDPALGFSVLLYTILAVVGILLLMFRRSSRACGRAELGGPTGTARLSALALIGLWITYITVVSLQAYEVINVTF